MRNSLLITAMLFCLAAAATAADQKKNDAQSQAQPQTEPAQMARNHVDDGPAAYTASSQNDCVPAKAQSQTKPRRNNSEGDPQASQNHVEYGGGG